ncbi:cell division protein ZipA [Salinibius halmophilus]|uniref:cell division protein ZipA n=1 Tax=Salinibius halmophilus TaxID=1853216 RepID=UPI000E66E709|nr:cell division protein ZipA [Salinibius halmophilus]
MDFIRDWLILFSIVVIAFIAWDAWRRVKAKNSYQGKYIKPNADADDMVSPVRKRQATADEVDHGRRTLRLDEDDDEPVPMLIDEVEQGEPLPDYEPPIEAFDEPELEALEDEVVEPEAPESAQEQVEEPVEVDEVLIIHVFAKDGQPEFEGADLLDNLLAANLKHGKMDIFHSHDEQGRLQFSIANGVNPGTLNPDTLADQTTPGVSLFLQLPHPGDAKAALDHMYKVAKFLAEEFSAALLDDQRSVLTPQTIEHYQQRITEYQRAQMIPH